jgi:hypothetical protein
MRLKMEVKVNKIKKGKHYEKTKLVKRSSVLRNLSAII